MVRILPILGEGAFVEQRFSDSSATIFDQKASMNEKRSDIMLYERKTE